MCIYIYKYFLERERVKKNQGNPFAKGNALQQQGPACVKPRKEKLGMPLAKLVSVPGPGARAPPISRGPPGPRSSSRRWHCRERWRRRRRRRRRRLRQLRHSRQSRQLRQLRRRQVWQRRRQRQWRRRWCWHECWYWPWYRFQCWHENRCSHCLWRQCDPQYDCRCWHLFGGMYFT